MTAIREEDDAVLREEEEEEEEEVPVADAKEPTKATTTTNMENSSETEALTDDSSRSNTSAALRIPFVAGDHITRWEMLPIVWPIQVHGIVLEAYDDRIVLVDFGLQVIREDVQKVDDKDTKMDLSKAIEEFRSNMAAERQRLNVRTLTTQKEMDQWSKVNYDGKGFLGALRKGKKDVSNPDGITDGEEEQEDETDASWWHRLRKEQNQKKLETEKQKHERELEEYLAALERGEEPKDELWNREDIAGESAKDGNDIVGEEERGEEKEEQVEQEHPPQESWWTKLRKSQYSNNDKDETQQGTAQDADNPEGEGCSPRPTESPNDLPSDAVPTAGEPPCDSPTEEEATDASDDSNKGPASSDENENENNNHANKEECPQSDLQKKKDQENWWTKLRKSPRVKKEEELPCEEGQEHDNGTTKEDPNTASKEQGQEPENNNSTKEETSDPSENRESQSCAEDRSNNTDSKTNTQEQQQPPEISKSTDQAKASGGNNPMEQENWWTKLRKSQLIKQEEKNTEQEEQIQEPVDGVDEELGDASENEQVQCGVSDGFSINGNTEQKEPQQQHSEVPESIDACENKENNCSSSPFDGKTDVQEVVQQGQGNCLQEKAEQKNWWSKWTQPPKKETGETQQQIAQDPANRDGEVSKDASEELSDCTGGNDCGTADGSDGDSNTQKEPQEQVPVGDQSPDSAERLGDNKEVEQGNWWTRLRKSHVPKKEASPDGTNMTAGDPIDSNGEEPIMVDETGEEKVCIIDGQGVESNTVMSGEQRTTTRASSGDSEQVGSDEPPVEGTSSNLEGSTEIPLSLPPKEQPKRRKPDPTALVLARTHWLLKHGEDVLPPYHAFSSNSECIAVFCKTGFWNTLQADIFLHSTAIANMKSGMLATLGAAASVPMLAPVVGLAGLAAVGAPWLYLNQQKSAAQEAQQQLTDAFWAQAEPEVFVACIKAWSKLDNGENISVANEEDESEKGSIDVEECPSMDTADNDAAFNEEEESKKDCIDVDQFVVVDVEAKDETVQTSVDC